MRWWICVILLLLAGCDASQSTRAVADAPAVTDLAGRGVAEAALFPTDAKASLFLFITTQCPIANSYAPEIERITQAYLARGVAIFLIHSDPDTTAAAAKEHAREYGLTGTVLLDPTRVLAKRFGATVTPEAAIATPDSKLHYLGRIDDRYVTFGVNREVITERNVRDALDALLAGKEIAIARAPAIGCYITLD